MNSVTNYVAENLDKTLSIERLAEIAHLSKFHFHRLHRALTGETVHAMVSRLRLEAAAATLMYQKGQPVTRVAIDHGYSSGANFTKAFTKHFGCSPSTYRLKSKIGKASAADNRENDPVELEVTTLYRPATLLAYLRRKGGYIHMDISSMHRQVQQWVKDNECAAREPASIGITWSDSLITEEENWTYDACVAVQPKTVGSDGIGIQTLQAGLVAQVEVELAENDSHDLSPYWDRFVRDWFLDSGYKLRHSPSYELYIETARGFRVRLCLPLETNDRRI